MTEGDAELELMKDVSVTPPLVRLVVKVLTSSIVNVHHICSIISSSNFRAHCVRYRGVQYRSGRVVVTSIQHDQPLFSEIQSVIVDTNNQVVLVVEQLTTVLFQHHMHRYQVEHAMSPVIFAVALDSLVDPHCMSFHSHASSQYQYVSTKYSVIH